MSIWGNLVGAVALSLTGGKMLGPLDMNGQPLSGLNAPTAPDHAANKAYVDNLGKAKAGFIYPLASAVVPEGFLLCDGAAYSRTEYPELFAAIGTMYGEGDGVTTFNVPNLVERMPAGAGDNHPVGEMVGEEKHEPTLEEMANHYHRVAARGGAIADGGNTAFSEGNVWGQSGNGNFSAYSYDVVEAVGESKPFNVMQPTTFIRAYIIATGKDTGVSVSDIVLGAQAIPLALEYGGLGATNAADARKNLEITPDNIGALTIELVWENVRPSSEFPPQTLNLDVKSDDLILVVPLYSNTYPVVKFPSFSGDSMVASLSTEEEGTYRDYHKTDGKITFTAGHKANAENNGMLIPYKIYKFKGVSV